MKNDNPKHSGFVPSQFSFVKSLTKDKVKCDLTRYHRSEDIRVKRLKFAELSGRDVGQCTVDYKEPLNVTCSLELQQVDNPRAVSKSEDFGCREDSSSAAAACLIAKPYMYTIVIYAWSSEEILLMQMPGILLEVSTLSTCVIR